jgi:hypothetical protein
MFSHPPPLPTHGTTEYLSRGRVEIQGVYLPSQLGAYTTTLYVMVLTVKGGGHGHAPPPALSRLG